MIDPAAIASLQSAMVAFAEKRIGERELVAICMAVNGEFEKGAGEAYAATAEAARLAMAERIAELDRGEP